MRRILIPGVLLLMLLSAAAALVIRNQQDVSPLAEEPYNPPPETLDSLKVTPQQVADRLGTPFTHPAGRGEVQFILMECWEEKAAERCQVVIYYANGWNLEIRTGTQFEAGWQAEDVANDRRGERQLVTVQGQLGVGHGRNTTGDELNPNGWPGIVVWIDPRINWLFALEGSYDLQTLLSFVNGPWCTLATPAGLTPPVPFC